MKIFHLIAALLLVASITIYGKNNGKPKNIIILIGDGMGIGQVSAALFSDTLAPWKQFPVTGFSVTCSADALITDSAAGATALATGQRTANRHLSITPEGKPIKTIMEYAREKGKSTGVVVTSTLTHATPAAFVSHMDERNKESEIARQYPQHHWNVMIGGGLQYFTPQVDGKYIEDSSPVINELSGKGYSVYTSADSLFTYPPTKDFYALIAKDGVPAARQRSYSLGQLTETALQHLNKNNKGFVLMIEGSQIDWACHNNERDNMYAELKDFHTAINAALRFAMKDKNTLVLVTADHETGGTCITNGKPGDTQPEITFVSKKHTAAMVGVFCYGPGGINFSGVQDNCGIGKKLINLVR
ncbi:MAG: alkaline phosphatase [Ignavibacteria bacterium]|nr:alkaline phosphatase [Ignavibacteria bacterium]